VTVYKHAKLYIFVLSSVLVYKYAQIRQIVLFRTFYGICLQIIRKYARLYSFVLSGVVVYNYARVCKNVHFCIFFGPCVITLNYIP